MLSSTSMALIGFSTFLYFSCTFTTVYGKCSGRWAIHACYGGNGKRSGPPNPETDQKLKENEYILRQLLLGSRLPSPSSTIELSDRPVIPDNPAINDPDTDYPAALDDQYESQSELHRIKSLLTDLLLQQRFRTPRSKTMDFRKR